MTRVTRSFPRRSRPTTNLDCTNVHVGHSHVHHLSLTQQPYSPCLLCEPCPVRAPGSISEGWFQHESLPARGRAIRLVRVLPQSDSFIRCSIRIVELKSVPYRCLSYQWGPTEKVHAMQWIILNGKRFRVRKNLWDFLKAAEALYNEEFWIDALCIDQANVIERNAQVAMMGDIYRDAFVITWLGKDVLVSCTVEGLGNRLHTCTPTPPGFKKLKDELELVIRVGNDSYWRRAWVIQEQLLARTVLLLCGSTEYTLENISSIHAKLLRLVGANNLITTWPPVSDPSGAVQRTLNSLHMAPFLANSQRKATCQSPSNSLRRHEVGEDLVAASSITDSQDHTVSSLPAVLKKHCLSECTEIHDRIYSLRWLTLEGPKIPVDYRMSSQELLACAIAAMERPFCLCFVIDLLQALPRLAEINSTIDRVVAAAPNNPIARASDKPYPSAKYLRVKLHIDGTATRVAQNMWQNRMRISEADGGTASTGPARLPAKVDYNLRYLCSNLRGSLCLQRDGGSTINVHFFEPVNYGTSAWIGEVYDVEEIWSQRRQCYATLSLPVPRLWYLSVPASREPCNLRNSFAVQEADQTIASFECEHYLPEHLTRF